MEEDIYGDRKTWNDPLRVPESSNMLSEARLKSVIECTVVLSVLTQSCVRNRLLACISEQLVTSRKRLIWLSAAYKKKGGSLAARNKTIHKKSIHDRRDYQAPFKKPVAVMVTFRSLEEFDRDRGTVRLLDGIFLDMSN